MLRDAVEESLADKRRQVLDYWLQSCSDGEWPGEPPADDETGVCLVDPVAIRQGMIAPAIYRKLLEAKKRQRSQEAAVPLDVRIFPHRFRQIPNHQKEDELRPLVLLPFWIPAKLTNTGNLLPHIEASPRFCRDQLSPLWVERSIAGTVAAMDRFAAANRLRPDSTWNDVWSHADLMLKELTGQTFETWCPEGYTREQPSSARIDLDPDEDYTRHIRKAYNSIPKDAALPVLDALLGNQPLNHLLPLEADDEKAAAAERQLAHFSSVYPLSESQREALRHLLDESSGAVFVLNGPPGTGKTTILKTVVACLWSSAAAAGRPPPVIAAASSTGQGSANIVSNFRIKDSSDSILQQRWIPDLPTYGVYVGNVSNNNEDRPLGLDSLDRVASCSYRVEQAFLQLAKNWLKQPAASLGEVLTQLRRELQLNANRTVQGLRTWRKQRQRQKELDAYRVELPRMIQAWHDARERETWWMRCFSWLPPVHRRRLALYARAWNGTGDPWDEKSAAAHWEKEKELVKHPADHPEWASWRADAGAQELPAAASLEKLEDWLDTHLRYENFWLTLHFWEASWLGSRNVSAEAAGRTPETPAQIKETWQRRAMLAPCTAATLFKLPDLFYCQDPAGQLLTDIVDLLIVDEAGQVLPHIAGASLALARRALVVGDTSQLQPVWKLPRMVDWANWRQSGLPAPMEIMEREEARGTTASRGSLMRMAQSGCRHRQHARLAAGFWLREHRRCLPEIIGYCNDLLYDGILRPMRPSPSAELHPLPPLGLIPVEGRSEVTASRINRQEVRMIGDWISANWAGLWDWYVNSAPKLSDSFEPLKVSEKGKLLAVVTPYRAQANLLRENLPRAVQSFVTVGTVDVLQGAERRIVLFSSVCTKGDSLRFLQELPNRLNVAVSRAQDSFLVFGDPAIFKGNSMGPLVMLGSKLKNVEKRGSTLAA